MPISAVGGGPGRPRTGGGGPPGDTAYAAPAHAPTPTQSTEAHAACDAAAAASGAYAGGRSPLAGPTKRSPLKHRAGPAGAGGLSPATRMAYSPVTPLRPGVGDQHGLAQLPDGVRPALQGGPGAAPTQDGVAAGYAAGPPGAVGVGGAQVAGGPDGVSNVRGAEGNGTAGEGEDREIEVVVLSSSPESGTGTDSTGATTSSGVTVPLVVEDELGGILPDGWGLPLGAREGSHVVDM
jgi:hypothetical protein